MLDWLASPIDPGRAHEITTLISWHARAMVLGWGVLIPSGIVIARYLKVLPGQDWPRELDNRFWWHSHLIFQITGFCIVLIGAALAWRSAGDGGLHGLLGWIIVGFGALQILMGWLRGTRGDPGVPGDHFDMTRRRRVFEAAHKVTGYALIAVAAINILNGLWLVNAPKWMWVAILGFWSGLIAFSTIAQRRNMVVSSYHAIWGPDPHLPGNRPRVRPASRKV